MSRKHRQRVATQERISADALASPYLHPEGPRGTLEVPATYLRGIARPQCFVVENNCLAPLGIVDGDSVLIDAANTAPRHGEIVACTFNGELLLKAYLCHGTGGRRLGFYKDGIARAIPVGPGDALTIIGVVALTIASGRRAWPVGRAGAVTA